MRAVLFTLMMLAVAGSSDRPVAAACGELLAGAASDEHLWLVVETDTPQRKVSLLHHALEMDGPLIRGQIELHGVPAAMAAWGNQVWMVFPTSPGALSSGREVFTLRVERDPTLGLHVVTPRDRLGVGRSLPGHGQLAGLVGTAEGLMALLVPPQWAEAGVTAREGATADPSALERPELLRLRNDAWTAVELPEGLGHRSRWLLAAGGEGGRQLTVVATDRDDRSRVEVHTRRGDGTWLLQRIRLDLDPGAYASRVDDRITLVLETRRDQVRVTYLQPTGLVDLMSFACPQQRWTVLGMRDGLHELQVDPSGEVTRARIDPITGAMGPREVMRAPLPSGSLWYISLLLAATVAALLFVFIVRPGQAAPLRLAEGQQVMQLDQRLMALCMDLFPAAVLTALVLQCRPLDLVRMPLITSTPEQTLPYLLMSLLTVLHAGTSELLAGRSLGKALMAGRVVALDGSRPRPRAILMRNALKLMMLAIPPLAVIVVVNPNGQGLGDIIARTIVVRERHVDAGPDANDR